jgi:small subunit ribosomal protein S23e
MGKPRGLRTARKHVKNRRSNVWADLDYKKAHLGTRWKANPFGGASHAKGIVLEKVRYFYYILISSLVHYISAITGF